MSPPKGTICAHEGEQKILFRVEGWAQMDLGLALRRLGEQGLARGATALLVDLQLCAYMDSTFLGTLLFLKRAVDRRACGCFALIAPSAECCRLLEELGLNDVLPIRPCEDLATCEWTPLSPELNDAEAFQRNVVQAHVELASLPGRAGEAFKKVAHLLEKEVATQKTWTVKKNEESK
jgi:anti-anti-sigma factor